jgi:tetratricopeptide (TPR) repeat protein
MTDQDLSAEPGGENLAAAGDSITISGNVVNSTIIIKSLVRDSQVGDLERQPPAAGDPPYLGLQFFREEDSARFYGREQLSARLIGRLQRTRFLAIIGASGSGKSSLVRACVIPALKRGERLPDGSLPPPNSAAWAMRVITPTAYPLEALAAALAPASAGLDDLAVLRKDLQSDAQALAVSAGRLLVREERPRLLLVIDQFEELFTQARSAEERQAFLDNLLAAVDPQEERPLTVVIILRADFYAQVAQHDRLRELVSQHQEFIGAMSRAELVDAIVGPLNKADWKIQEGLVKVILDDVGYEPGALPLLSHALLETWKRRRGRTLTLSGYVEAGGVSGAVRETAEAVFRQRLTPAQQPIARMIFLRLTELGQDSQDTRRRVPFSELITRSSDELTIQAVLNILTEARLVTVSTSEPGEQKVVEVSHESLIREWPTLCQWLEEDRQGLILQRQFTEAATDWQRLGRDPGALYRGLRLTQIEDWERQNPNDLNQLERDFLEASQEIARLEAIKEAKVRRARRVQQAFIGVTLGLTAVVLLLVFFGDRLRPQPPPKMDRFYNIAVAGLTGIDESGNPLTADDDRLLRLGDDLAQVIEGQLGENPNILIWSDSPELASQRVVIGAPQQVDQAAAAQWASQTAERLNADMLIYGALDLRRTPPVLALKAMFPFQSGYPSDEVQGIFDFAFALQVPEVGDIDPALGRTARRMAWIALGLNEGQLGHSLEALDAYLKASAESDTSSESLLAESITYFFIGREFLFLADRGPIRQFARREFEQAAQDAFERALELDPSNARALIGLGTLNIKRAQCLLDERLRQACGLDANIPIDLEQAHTHLEQAVASYNLAVQASANGRDYGVPIKSISFLGIAQSLLLQASAYWMQSDLDQARQVIDLSIERMLPLVEQFKAAGQPRYLAQNLQFLGNAYQWSAFLLEQDGEYSQSVKAYRLAIDYFERCIAQGEGSQDVIVLNGVIAENCRPGRDSAQRRVDVLTAEQ